MHLIAHTATAAGDSERLLGMWMKNRKNRSEVFLVDKGGHPHTAVPRPRLSPEELAHDIHESLLRLQTDYIDLFLLHRDDPSIPAGTIIEHLNREIRAGNLRAIGASNWELERLQEANEYARRTWITRICGQQQQYQFSGSNGTDVEGRCVRIGNGMGMA